MPNKRPEFSIFLRGNVLRKGAVAFANFICTFGEAGAMLDNWDIVGPAFLTDTLVRKYGQNYFHFYEVKLVKLGEDSGVPVLAVCGHFVKNVNLTREQTFDKNGQLIKAPASMPSSPSAFFVLILNTHRLVYFAETAHAPDLKSFETTAANFIKRYRERKINEEYKASQAKVTKKALQEQLPRPTVTVVPLAERERITDFINRFETIKLVKFRLIKPNHETDASEVVSAVRETIGAMKPDHLDIIATNSAGLDISQVKQVVGEATEVGNTDIAIKGEDKDGVQIRGTNDEFALTVDLEKAESTDAGLRGQLYNMYQELVAAGKIKLGDGLGHVADKIKSIAAIL